MIYHFFKQLNHHSFQKKEVKKNWIDKPFATSKETTFQSLPSPKP